MERCILCGGKIGSNGRCTECGLDNTKNDKKYRLNTHNEKAAQMHPGDCEENLNRDNSRKKAPAADKKSGAGKARSAGTSGKNQSAGASGKNQSAWQMAEDGMSEARRTGKVKERRQAGTVKKKSGVLRLTRWIVILIVVVEILSAAVEALPDLFSELPFGGSEILNQYRVEEVPPGPEQIEWDEAADGYFETELAPGFYEIGYEIPAGAYQLSCDEGTSWIYVQNPDESYGTYLALYSQESQEAYREAWQETCEYYEFSKELKLSEHGILYVQSCDSTVRIAGEGDGVLKSRKAQGLSETVRLEDGMVAGADFEPGVYNIVLNEADAEKEDYSTVGIDIEKWNEEDTYYISLYPENPVFYCFSFEVGDTVELTAYADGTASIVPAY